MKAIYGKKLVMLALAVVFVSAAIVNAENIDPYDEDSQYAYGENVGWLNFEPGQGPGVQVSSADVQGFVWAENIGWINLSPTSHGGVVNDGAGNLSGYAWGENVGWINFAPTVPGDPADYGVKIDDDGNFSGWAWGENIGWVNFNLIENYVTVCKVNFEDLANFMSQWLVSGSGNPADLNIDNDVDLFDYSIFAGYWLDYCPDNWQLK